mmetsp:Transcript_37785/g.70852  ORF Transcript_37785/g.70852 Transcript_37785/m.70852 type:complete len:283 (-) Transcript_37785:2-850(-)
MALLLLLLFLSRLLLFSLLLLCFRVSWRGRRCLRCATFLCVLLRGLLLRAAALLLLALLLLGSPFSVLLLLGFLFCPCTITFCRFVSRRFLLTLFLFALWGCHSLASKDPAHCLSRLVACTCCGCSMKLLQPHVGLVGLQASHYFVGQHVDLFSQRETSAADCLVQKLHLGSLVAKICSIALLHCEEALTKRRGARDLHHYVVEETKWRLFQILFCHLRLCDQLSQRLLCLHYPFLFRHGCWVQSLASETSHRRRLHNAASWTRSGDAQKHSTPEKLPPSSR